MLSHAALAPARPVRRTAHRRNGNPRCSVGGPELQDESRGSQPSVSLTVGRREAAGAPVLSNTLLGGARAHLAQRKVQLVLAGALASSIAEGLMHEWISPPFRPPSASILAAALNIACSSGAGAEDRLSLAEARPRRPPLTPCSPSALFRPQRGAPPPSAPSAPVAPSPRPPTPSPPPLALSPYPPAHRRPAPPPPPRRSPPPSSRWSISSPRCGPRACAPSLRARPRRAPAVAPGRPPLPGVERTGRGAAKSQLAETGDDLAERTETSA